MPKINSIRFGATWIVISLVIGLLLPVVIWITAGVFYWGLSIIGGINLLGSIIVLCKEKQQDSGDIPFDSDKQIAVIRCSICTGEQVAGFKSKEDGHFTEVMLIRDDKDLAEFKEIYRIEEIKKEY